MSALGGKPILRFDAETEGTALPSNRLDHVSERQIVAVGLLTQNELLLLGEGFDLAWPIDEIPCFQGLLEAIDEADRELWRARDGAGQHLETAAE